MTIENKETESPGKKFIPISSRSANRLSMISIIIIVVILTGGLAWKAAYDANSNYIELDYNIAFIHSNDGYNEQVFDKLSLDASFNFKLMEEEDLVETSLTNIDFIILSNVDLSDDSRAIVKTHVESSEQNAVIILMGNNTDGTDLNYLNIISNDNLINFIDNKSDLGYGICKDTGAVPELTASIPWNTLPEIKSYTRITEDQFELSDAKSSSVILKDYSSSDSEDVFLFHKDLKVGGQYLVYTMWFDSELNIQELTNGWPYMGYLFYSSVLYLKGQDIPNYNTWPYSPVPHFGDYLLIAFLLGGFSILLFVAFSLSRKKSEENPLKGIEAFETPEEIKAKESAREEIEKLKSQTMEVDLGLDDETLQKIKENKCNYEEIECLLPDHLKGWNAIGIHRQISGFWTLFFALLIMILPLALFFLWIYPTFIFTTPSGMGYYNFVMSFFGALWVFSDFGTSYWAIRKFAAHRINEPKKAIASAQLFLWFQILSGSIQVVFVGFLGALIFPLTPWWPHLSLIFVWHSLYQWFGFAYVYVYILKAFQRSDVSNISEAAMAPIFMIVQGAFVPIFSIWGASTPSVGIALGGAIGSSVANLMSYVLLFIISWYLFKKSFGYSGTSVFRVDFSSDMVRDMFSFGWRFSIGHVLIPLVKMVEVILLSIYLDNYNNWLGYLSLITIVGQVYMVIDFFAKSMVPSIAEAQENDKNVLVNYNINAMLRWNNHFNFWLSSALLAIAVPLIFAISPSEFQGMAVLAPIVIGFQLIGPFSWMGDNVLIGTNNPSYIRNAWIIEQSIRFLLLLVFVPFFSINPQIGIFSIYFAYYPALFAKIFYVWILVKKKILTDLKIYWYKVFIVPALAGFILYGIVLLIMFIAGGGFIGAIIGAVAGLLGGPFLYYFLSGLLGGWSDDGLEEFTWSVKIMSIGGILGRALLKCCNYGAKISPWRDRGNIDIYVKARVEAWELTIIKKKIEDI